MKVSHLLMLLFVGAFSLSSAVYATGESSGDRGGAQGDSTRERGDIDHDRGQGEKNRDDALQSAETASASEKGHGTSISNISVGEAHGKNFGILKDHR